MAIQKLAGPDELPPEGHHTIYIVSDADPRYIIAGKSGDVYGRRDGKPWKGDGFHVEQEFAEDGSLTGPISRSLVANRIIGDKGPREQKVRANR